MSIRGNRWAFVTAPLQFDERIAVHNCKVARGERSWPVAKGLRKAIYRRDNGKCYYCGSTHELTLDHKVPQSRGGSNHADNLVTACHACNTAKGVKHISEFVSRRFGKGAA